MTNRKGVKTDDKKTGSAEFGEQMKTFRNIAK
jgi:hypothetical protein